MNPAQCQGVLPLSGRWANWMLEIVGNPDWLRMLVDQCGSPLHLHAPKLMQTNANRLLEVAEKHDIEFEIYFARKANKCPCYIQSASAWNGGVDTASYHELQEAHERGIAGTKLVYTAAVKEPRAIDLAIHSGTTIVVDNLDELHCVEQRLSESSIEKSAQLALRLRGFSFTTGRHRSRFGVDLDQASAFISQSLAPSNLAKRLHWRGLHFHLDGSVRAERVAAIHQSLDLIGELRQKSVPLEFIDMGGGFPVCYLRCESEWHAFWQSVREHSSDFAPPGTSWPTFEADGRAARTHFVYPFWQAQSADAWLDDILSGTNEYGTRTDCRLRNDRVTLRCEPGRALVNECGVTLAEVAFRKLDSDGNLLVGLAMNRTHCRTTSFDFLVDPQLVACGTGDRLSGTGFFVGAYCMENEYILARKMRFCGGVAVGDIVVFPNTAGYFMHFMESRSHLFDLPKNLVIDGEIVSGGTDIELN